MKYLAAFAFLALVGCLNEKERTDELLTYKVEDFEAKNGRPPGETELVALRSEAVAQEREEAKERKAEALKDAASGVGALASGNLIGGGLLLGGAVLTFFGLRGQRTGKPSKA